MSINLYKHRDELIQSYKDVIDDKNPTEWAVYGYAKDSYDLVLDSTGSGLDQLVDELDSSKIQYAFVRVVDPKTELIKFVLINWVSHCVANILSNGLSVTSESHVQQQGEGAALSRKGICANHIRDVSGFFRGAHISINARNEDEVEPAVIIERVAKASATKLNLKERSEPVDNIAPVGTNYSRIKPALEINSSQRESFWQQQQEEERSRKINERKRAEVERKKLEEAEKLRELREAKEREQLLSQKERDLNKRREEEKNAENRARDRMESRATAAKDEEDEDPEEAISRRAEQMRQNRAEEARTLISGSSIRNARAMFEQNSSVSQLTRPQPVPKPAAAVTNSLVSMTRKNFIPSVAETKNGSAIPAANGNRSNETTKSPVGKKVPEKAASPSPPPKQPERIDPVTQPAAVPQKARAPSPVEEDPKHQQFIEGEEDEDPDSGLVQTEEELLRAVYNDVPITDHILEDIQEESEEAEHEDDVPKPKGTGQQEIKARALYDYQAADETEISFDPDDIITHVDMIDPGWYQGMAPDGSYGLFPANYVEIIQ